MGELQHRQRFTFKGPDQTENNMSMSGSCHGLTAAEREGKAPLLLPTGYPSVSTL